MKDFIRNYKMKIQALSPIHIGSGEKISKKEYINLWMEHKVIIPDPVRMYCDLCKKGLEKDYTEYMLNSNLELGVWMKNHGIRKTDYQRWKRYEMDSGDAFSNIPGSRTVRPKEIMSFVKDAYRLPYVPGSSLKGMLRTALLAYNISHNPVKYRSINEEIKEKTGQREKRHQCLSGECMQLETEVFHTLNRDKNSKNSAVNCNLSGLYISDSQPLTLEDLTLSQKIDYTMEGKEKPLPILRETLIPGTEIYFEITIDRTQCPYTIENIMEALEEFQQCAYKYFYSKFYRGSSEEGIIWLGGGCGFLSKTILYPFFKEQAVKITDGVFKNTLGKNYSVHKHYRDIPLKLAPHVCKCTRYNGRLYDMGMGKIERIGYK